MKFTTDDAFKSLEGYLTDNGRKDLLMSQRSVKQQIEALMPLLADDETELSVFVEKVKPTFKTMQDNLRYDNSNFVKKWNAEHPEPASTDPQPADPQPQQATGEYAELLKRLEKLEKEKAEADAASALKDRRAQLSQKLQEKGVKDKEWLESLLSEVTLPEGADIEAKAEQCLKLYNRGGAHAPANVTPMGAGAPVQPADANPFADIAKMRAAQEQGRGELKK